MAQVAAGQSGSARWPVGEVPEHPCRPQRQPPAPPARAPAPRTWRLGDHGQAGAPRQQVDQARLAHVGPPNHWRTQAGGSARARQSVGVRARGGAEREAALSVRRCTHEPPSPPTCKLGVHRGRALVHLHARLDKLCALDLGGARRRQHHLRSPALAIRRPLALRGAPPPLLRRRRTRGRRRGALLLRAGCGGARLLLCLLLLLRLLLPLLILVAVIVEATRVEELLWAARRQGGAGTVGKASPGLCIPTGIPSVPPS